MGACAAASAHSIPPRECVQQSLAALAWPSSRMHCHCQGVASVELPVIERAAQS